MKEKRINLGIQIVRMIFSFHILLFHCINKKLYRSKTMIAIISDVNIDLGVFFIISFYYSYNSFIIKNLVKIKQRFYRLLIPYIIWPLIFFSINNFIFYIYGNKKFYIKLELLYYQLLIGNGIHIVFWFLFNLIFITIFFLIIIFISKRRYLPILIIIGLLFYIFLSSNYYKRYFSYDTILFFSIKKIPTAYIYSLFGFIFFYLNNFVNLKQYRIKISFLSLFFFYLYLYDKHLLKIEAYFHMIRFLTCASAFIFFLILPLHEINVNFIKIITSYSGGIYYLHTKVKKLLEFFFKGMKSSSFTVCIINYLLCYLICLIGSKIFKKVSLRYLFE